MPPENDPVAPRRPASVVWASVVLALGSIVNVLLAFRGTGSVLTFGLALAFTVASLAVSFGGRRYFGYLCGALALAAFSLSGLWHFALYFVAYQRGQLAPSALAVLSTVMAVITGLFTFLFYRFTFARPSRRFYGLLAPSDIHGT